MTTMAGGLRCNEMTGRQAPRSRSEVISDAVIAELLRREKSIDADGSLIKVTVTIKLEAGTTRLRGVSWQEDRVARKTREDMG